MNFVLPLRPSRSAQASKTLKPLQTTRSPHPPASPRRRPSLATRAGVVKRRSSVTITFNAPSMSFFEALFGDDWPGAFASGDGRSCKSRMVLPDLPAEIFEIIGQYLSNSQIKLLRLVNREIAEKVELRIDRVYVSPNRANLDHLKIILDHPRYRLRVQEIVWDDAQLDPFPNFVTFNTALLSDQRKAKRTHAQCVQTPFDTVDSNSTQEDSNIMDSQEEGSIHGTVEDMPLSSSSQASRNNTTGESEMMAMEDSYALYQKLYQDEKEIIKRGWDVTALQRALVELPSLKCITLTGEVWKSCNSTSNYASPFLRALPPGFQKPSLSPWSELGRHQVLPDTEISIKLSQLSTEEHLPTKWRGYSIIMSSLATCPVPQLEKFIVDAGNDAPDGLPQHLFAMPNLDYDNTIRALSATRLKELRISLISHSGSTQLNLLHNLVNALPNLEHLDLTWNTTPGQAFPFEGELSEHTYRTLRSIALRRSEIDSRWLLHLIQRSGSLESVTLDQAKMIPSQDPWTGRRSFFAHIKDYYALKNHRGPSFRWVERPWYLALTGQWHMLDDELDAFLYDGAESPWHDDVDVGNILQRQSMFRSGFGWIIDANNPQCRQKRLRE